MRHSIRRWIDWLMTDLIPPSRPHAGGKSAGQSVHVRYEKAGLTLDGPPVPWNADGVRVELLLRIPPSGRHRSDFVLRVPGQPPVPAEQLRRDDPDGRVHRLTFRVPTPPTTTSAEITWKHRLLTTIAIPVVSADEYIAGLRIGTPTVSVRIDGTYIAARTFVTTQCQGLLASLVLRSPVGLAPLADLGVSVVFRSDRSGVDQTVRVPLTSAQLAAGEVLLTAAPAKLPKAAGNYSVDWQIGGRSLYRQRVSAVTGRRFTESLRISEARIVVADTDGGMRIVRQRSMADPAMPSGPSFTVASREPGAAGLVELDVAAMPSGAGTGNVVFRQTVLITDGPTVFAPGLMEVSSLSGLAGFELRHKSSVLGSVSVRPVPSAAFDGEGGFKPPPDFTWSNGADDELGERLSKLMGNGDGP